ncbi:oxidoreductase [Aestuariimicrobium sp. Y1814]|uniref:oxidoreductase n=1 Tax=Aestuariimicrobium sp. Y1814 TaxID=3418742 RepID=UPI003DA75514
MTRVLVLGGTAWLGARIAAGWAASGAEVFCLARGESGAAPEGCTLVRADRHDPSSYDGLVGEWDEVVELSYEPEFVGPALAALAPRAAHWTLVSTVSVYAGIDRPGADESAALVRPRDLTQYPDAKVAAEVTTAEHVGDRLLLARPGLIVGPGDTSDRFGYWTARLSRGGAALAPVTAGRHVQVIDVDDLAGWLVAAGARGLVGTVNAVGPSITMDEFFAEAMVVSGHADGLVMADDDELRSQGVNHWAGPRSLPLWVPRDLNVINQLSRQAFVEAGGMTRPLQATLQRTLADELARGIDRERRSGLTAAEEAAASAAILEARAG